jgi:hypothetical protein
MLQLSVRTLALHYTGASYPRIRSLVYILTGASLSGLLLGRWIHFVSVCIWVSMVVWLRHALEGLELVELLLGRVAIDSPFLLDIGLGILFPSNWLLLLLLVIHEVLHISNILMGLRRLCDSRLESGFLGIVSLNLLWRIRRLLGGTACILLILISNYQAHNLLVAQETLTWGRVVGTHISVMVIHSERNVPLIRLSYCYLRGVDRSTDRAWSSRGKDRLLDTLDLLTLLRRRSILFVHLINHFNLFVWNLAIIVS